MSNPPFGLLYHCHQTDVTPFKFYISGFPDGIIVPPGQRVIIEVRRITEHPSGGSPEISETKIWREEVEK